MKKFFKTAAAAMALCIGLSSAVYADETQNTDTFETEPMIACGMIGGMPDEDHTLALSSDGHVWSWGQNFYGELGNGTYNYGHTPSKVLGLSKVEKVFAGPFKSAAIKNDGTVWEWGEDSIIPSDPSDFSSLLYYISKPRLVEGISNVKTIVYPALYSLALKNDGTVWIWGTLGSFPDYEYITTPTKVDGITDIKDIYCDHMSLIVLLKNDGTVWLWGDGNEPSQVNGLENIVSLGSGIALKNDGTVWAYSAWEPEQAPVQIMDDVKAIGSGWNSNTVIKNDGTAWKWGFNNCGNLGIGNSEANYTDIPVQIKNIQNVVSVVSDSTHSTAMTADGSVWVWGVGTVGGLGSDAPKEVTEPVKIPNLNLLADHSREFTAVIGGANQTGKVEAADSAVILQKVLNNSYVMPIEFVTDDYLTYLDVDCDGTLTAADSAIVLQKVLNSGFEMPIESAGK